MAPEVKKPAGADSRSSLVAEKITDVRERITAARTSPDIVVSLVPTMGSFHEGHLSLMRAARAESDFVVVSIFVNPAQFGPAEDLEAYPRDLEHDLELAAHEGVDLVFSPAETEMYPQAYETFIEVGQVADGLCGQGRPGHFRGVATVVAKLFNIVRPDVAYFGQKDAQQAAVIRRVATDLDIATEIRVCPIVREADGLAMSSRNSYLTDEERIQAPALYNALLLAKESVENGESDAARIRKAMRRAIGQHYLLEFEYARIVDPDDLKPVATVDRKVLAAVAARAGKARLIDNMLIEPLRR
ncbi:MAG: pantoate--beta-alanine ligase [Actinobacteria bacterium]|nr:pantoate--beta-alanine ligase [Actinomycetota bacterium]